MTGRSTVPKRRPAANAPAPDIPPVTATKAAPRWAPPQPVKVRLRRWPRPRAFAGMAVVFVGLAMFLIANIGARTGWVTLPGDPHHVFGQVVGITLFFIGIGVVSPNKSSNR
jgi:hypothetical protein